MLEIPSTASDFSVEWMNAALANKLGSSMIMTCRGRDSDIPGQTAEIVLLDVQYDDNVEGLPERFVAKITSRNPLVLTEIIANYDQYRRETSFYREFPDAGIAVPWCLYEQHAQLPERFVILMKDLAPSESPSWAVSPAQVEVALGALPAFHAKWWNKDLLREKDWMVQFDNRDFYKAAFNAANQAGTTLTSLYEDPELTREIMAYVDENLTRIMHFVASRSFTFVHGDYHAKQMFFPTSQGGDFAVIDWQFPFVAQGPWDFARMAGMCLETGVRRENEQRLIAAYVEGLSAAGVKDYDQAEFETDYRMGLAVSQMIMSIASADTDISIFERECEELGLDWKDIVFYRTQQALQEWDVLDFVKSL
jgi:Phosphotransferase enzyme family